MPSVRLEVLRLYPAESQEKHGEYQKRLDEGHRIGKEGTGRVKRRQRMIYKINGCSRHHRYGQHPFFDYLSEIHFVIHKILKLNNLI